MGHDLRDDDVAGVTCRFTNEVSSEWHIDISISLVISPDNEIPEDIMTRVIGIATLMSAFLDVAADNPEIHDIVEEHRNYLMKLEEEEKPVVIRDGNVYTLDIWTKTKGNA